MALEASTRLGSFEIVESIGSGSMGEVYRAKDLKLGRQVALKALLPEFASDDDRLRRFEQEARAASALNHPNIVHIYDIGEDKGTHYIVMELVEGTNLRQLLRRAPFANEKLLELAQQMAAGLAKAHDAGIVHRDVKPENMMVTLDGFLKILDFGLAKLLDVPFETHSEMATMVRQGTRHGMLIGTVEYMSPEQAAGKSVDHRSDQFSLGLILYEMATGTLAFRRATAAQTLASIIESDPKPIVELNDACPSDLVRIVKRCLRKPHTERYEDTRDLLRDLKAVSLHQRELPPIPPVPQIPEPDVPSFGGAIRGQVRRDVRNALSEAEREIRDTFGEPEFYLRSRDGVTKSISERRLRRKLRRNRFSGDEMVRRGDEGEWVHIYESDLFRQEVPYSGGSGRLGEQTQDRGLPAARLCFRHVRDRMVRVPRRSARLDGLLGHWARLPRDGHAPGGSAASATKARAHRGANARAAGGARRFARLALVRLFSRGGRACQRALDPAWRQGDEASCR